MHDTPYDDHCKHGTSLDEDCAQCNEYTCRHGVVFKGDEDYCQKCDDAEDAEMNAGCDDEICKHGLYESNCHQCGAETDNLIEQANAQRDWNHWHPAEE